MKLFVVDFNSNVGIVSICFNRYGECDKKCTWAEVISLIDIDWKASCSCIVLNFYGLALPHRPGHHIDITIDL